MIKKDGTRSATPQKMAATEKTSALEGAAARCALALTRHTARVLTQLYDRHLSESEVEAAQFALMMTLDAATGRSQAELGRMMGMDKTTLSRNLKVLQGKGWVEAVAAKDARQRRMSLTVEGQRRLAAAKPAWKRAQDDLRGRMSPAEWDAMWGVMWAVTRAAAEASSEDGHFS